MYKISNSVGRHGVNRAQDIFIVQSLLNRHIVPPNRLLKVDSIVGPKTINTIIAFQRRVGFHRPDGLVSPSGRTFTALCSLPQSAPVTENYFIDIKNITKKISDSIGSLGSKIESSLKSIGSPQPQPKVSQPIPHLPASPPGSIAWGAKVTPQFKKRIIEICKELGINPDFLMSCMALETGETFRTDIRNKKGSGATGLIQFMPDTAMDYGTTTNKLAKMTPVEQLEYVKKYFMHRKGKLHTLEDVYMAILYPAAIGKSPNTVLFKAGTKKYDQNDGFDADDNDEITIGEISSTVRAKYKKGLTKGFFG
jgi:hypothetical protein